MRYKLLGHSGLRVSELALGTMTFGPNWGWRAEKDECKAMFEAFADAGGNFVDTANRYTNGTAEKFVGEFVAADRGRFVVASKYTLSRNGADPNGSGNHRKSLVESLDRSLRRLNTDYIDVNWVHIWDPSTPLAETVRALDDQSGRARSCTSGSPTRRRGSSPGPRPWPRSGGGPRSAPSRAGTAWSTARPIGSCRP